MLTRLAWAGVLLLGLTGQGYALDIDNAYHAYGKETGGHKAFAYTRLGTYWWQGGEETAARARQVALEQCETVRMPGERSCMIGDVDGRIVDKRFRRVLAGTLRQPVRVTVEENGETRTFAGTMTVQRHWSPARRVSIAYANGTRSCTGGRAYLGLGIRFSIQCEGKTFAGRAKRLGTVASGFYQGTELFEARVSSGGTTMTVTNAR